jgi:hypothetical protein
MMEFTGPYNEQPPSSTSKSKNKVQELNKLRVIFWMMPGNVKYKPSDQYRIVFEEEFANLSSPMTPISLGDGKFLYVNQVLLSKNRLNRDKEYKINYRYELIRYSEKLKRIKVVSESRVTSGTDNFTRQLDFRKHGFSHFENELYSLVEFQQFDVLAVFNKKGMVERLIYWVKGLDSEKNEVFQQDLSLYFAACVLNCCGLLTSSPTGRIQPPDSIEALQIELTLKRLAKLRDDFQSYLDRAGFSYQEVPLIIQNLDLRTSCGDNCCSIAIFI